MICDANRKEVSFTCHVFETWEASMTLMRGSGLGKRLGAILGEVGLIKRQ
jgi:hypothetical protein